MAAGRIRRIATLGMLVYAALGAMPARALGPHEILVVANAAATDSVALARYYLKLRQIPEGNLVLAPLPAAFADNSRDISAEDFTRFIWEPTCQAVRQRGLESQILAWVYSAGFPVRVSTSPPLSLTGMTFVRNRPPGNETLQKDAYASPLYAGPSRPGQRGFQAQSLDVLKSWLGDGIPLPSMMLGVLGPCANTPEEVRHCLARGAEADGTQPDGAIFFVTNTDVRTQCRLWEIVPAAKELEQQGIRVAVTNVFPMNCGAVLGIMTGAATVDPGRGNRYLPGSIGEHLTSFAGVFEETGQTRMTEWIKAGACVTAGTVTEPMSNWTKFPHARLFVHYAAGCTVLESLYQAVKSPLQLLPIGDPLAAPWAPRARLTLAGLGPSAVAGNCAIKVNVQAPAGMIFDQYVFLVNGRVCGRARFTDSWRLETRTLTNGSHVLRGVAYSTGVVRQQVFAEQSFRVANP